MIVWDLCGGSQNSVYNALKDNPNYEIYTFDINPNLQHKNQYVMDLSNVKCLDELDKFPKPDIIVASPLCSSFTHILNTPRKYGKSTRLAWKFDNTTNQYKLRTIEEIEQFIKSNGFFRHYKAANIRENGLTGGGLLNNIISIIIKFKPEYWYIENPANSLMWDFIITNLGFDGAHWYNRAHYYCYDLNFSKKPTIFLSNVKMDLKTDILKSDIKLMGNQWNPKTRARSKTCSYGGPQKEEQGSNVKIPELLIKDIFKHFKENNEKKQN